MSEEMQGAEGANDGVGFVVKDGEVLMGDVVVATFTEEALRVKKDYVKQRGEIEVAVDEWMVEQDGGRGVGGAGGMAGATVAILPVAGGEKGGGGAPMVEVPDKFEGVVEEGKVQARVYAAEVADDVAFARANGVNGVPMPPAKNPQFGDKTPAYVDWLKAYRPEKYREKFGVTVEGLRIERFHDDGTHSHFEVLDVAARKTHRTEAMERDVTLDASMDWNA